MRHGGTRGRWRASVGLLLTLGVLFVDATSLAQGAQGAQGENAHATAVARFEEGTQLVKQGDCSAAIPKFLESLKSEEGVGARLNLADCYARTGASAQAWLEFKAAERFATLKRNDERREVAHNGAYALERKLLRLTLTIPFVEGLAVRINSTAIDTDLLATRQIAIEPGPFEIEATATKKLPVIKRGSGAAGEVQAVTIAFEDDRSAILPPPPPPETVVVPSTAQRTAGIVVVVAGLAAVAAGSVLGVVAIEKKNDLEQAFDTNPSCTSHDYPNGTCTSAARVDLESRQSSAFTAATASTVFFIVGGVALASGAALFLMAPSSHKPRAAKQGFQLGAAARALLLGGAW